MDENSLLSIFNDEFRLFSFLFFSENLKLYFLLKSGGRMLHLAFFVNVSVILNRGKVIEVICAKRVYLGSPMELLCFGA